MATAAHVTHTHRQREEGRIRKAHPWMRSYATTNVTLSQRPKPSGSIGDSVRACTALQTDHPFFHQDLECVLHVRDMHVICVLTEECSNVFVKNISGSQQTGGCAMSKAQVALIIDAGNLMLCQLVVSPVGWLPVSCLEKIKTDDVLTKEARVDMCRAGPQGSKRGSP